MMMSEVPGQAERSRLRDKRPQCEVTRKWPTESQPHQFKRHTPDQRK